MSQTRPVPAPDTLTPAGARRGILHVLGAAAAFALAAACVKGLGGEIPLAQVILCRNLFAIPALLPLLRAAGGWAALRTSHPLAHAQRLGWGLLGMVGAFWGYATLPLATATALGFTMPLFLTLIAVLFMGERLRWRRSLAVFCGFLGVLVVVRPGGAGGLDLVAAGMVLLGAFGWAMAMVTIRRMGALGEAGVSIVLWFAFSAAAVAAVASLPVWVWPTPAQWALLAGCGVVSALGQVLMTEAYRSGEASLLAPFEYSGILWTALLGAVLWAEVPDGAGFAGILILVGSGLYIWRREAQLGIKR
jgi:drug/metabolite transporter (DMT)-like permease